MLIADVILLVVFAVLAVLFVAHHRAYHVDQAHLQHLREDYGKH